MCRVLNRFAYTGIFGCAILVLFFYNFAAAGDIATNVEKILREVPQDRPVPSVDYLKKTQPVNIDCAYYRGDYQSIEIAVETHPNSQKVASVLLKIPGPDRTKEVLPAVKRVIGPPKSSNPKKSEYGWEWPGYRTGSVHYAKGSRPGEGFTVISLFYR